jgi:hypothetical protein
MGKAEPHSPPQKSKGLLSDIRHFLLNKPEIPTLITFKSESERLDYSQRIIQRIGIHVSGFTILNIHKIGIDIPVNNVFEKLLNWNGDSTYWPNYIAKVVRMDNRLENIQIALSGFTENVFGLKNNFLARKFMPLFNLKAIKFQLEPDLDFENARYLLYECSGGYPIGIFCMYVRSSIAERNEVEQSQLYFAVSFNFYGRKDWSERKIINRTWEYIHNRASANIVNRFKQLCEWRFEKNNQNRV